MAAQRNSWTAFSADAITERLSDMTDAESGCPRTTTIAAASNCAGGTVEALDDAGDVEDSLLDALAGTPGRRRPPELRPRPDPARPNSRQIDAPRTFRQSQT